jgi:hypothetical protein
VVRVSITYAGDDPVNSSDPTGLSTVPQPTPSPTSYEYSFDLGTLGTSQQIAAFVNEDCAAVFPIAGCMDNFYRGEDMLLQKTFLFGIYTQSFPVQVASVGSTFFQFVARKGHPEGQGRKITFDFSGGSDCGNQDVFLHVYTSEQGSFLTQFPGVRTLDFWVAHETWAGLSDNIKAAYPWWAQSTYASGPPKLA